MLDALIADVLEHVLAPLLQPSEQAALRSTHRRLGEVAVFQQTVRRLQRGRQIHQRLAEMMLGASSFTSGSLGWLSQFLWYCPEASWFVHHPGQGGFSRDQVVRYRYARLYYFLGAYTTVPAMDDEFDGVGYLGSFSMDLVDDRSGAQRVSVLRMREAIVYQRVSFGTLKWMYYIAAGCHFRDTRPKRDHPGFVRGLVLEPSPLHRVLRGLLAVNTPWWFIWTFIQEAAILRARVLDCADRVEQLLLFAMMWTLAVTTLHSSDSPQLQATPDEYALKAVLLCMHDAKTGFLARQAQYKSVTSSATMRTATVVLDKEYWTILFPCMVAHHTTRLVRERVLATVVPDVD